MAKAMKHQRVSLEHDAANKRVLDLSDAGTGKTCVRILAFSNRRRTVKGYGALLVLAPRSLLRAVWRQDFAKFAPDMKVVVADAANREKAFAEEADVYVTNHDGVKWLAKQKPAFFKRFSEVAVDESPAFKHHTSQRGRAAARIMKHFDRRALMTMTPTSNGICDIWHQVFLLDDGKRLGPSFYSFRNSVCTSKQVGANVHALRFTDKEGAEEAVYSLIDDLVVRHRLDDCADIPETHFHTLLYSMSDKHRKAYEQLERDQLLPLISQAGSNPTGRAAKVLAINAAAAMTKLLQLASGAVYDAAGEYHVLDTGRYELILDLAEERKHPLVFFYWKHQMEMLAGEAEKRGLTFAVINGDTPDVERASIQRAYQQGEYDVVFAHPKTTAHGFTFTAGTSTIWAGPTHDLEWFTQGSRRQRRIGQKHKTEVLTLLAEGTREIEIYDHILMPKEARMSNLLSLFVQGMADRASRM